jgi:hypothetical protein
MAERDKGNGRDIRLPSADKIAQAREREGKLRMLKRLGDALGRPVGDFYTAEPEVPPDASGGKAQR